MIVSLIVAMSENHVIGKGGTLPWHLPADLKRFKTITMSHPIVMGRKTYESIGRPLPGRKTVILTRDQDYGAPETLVVHSFDEALDLLCDEDEVFVIGGAAIFHLAWPKSHRLYLTQVHTCLEGDVFFPRNALDGWTLSSDERHPADEKHEFPFSFRVYEKN